MAFIHREKFQKQLAEYPAKLEAWLETNPEPRQLEWKSPEFLQWISSNMYSKPLNEADLNTHDIFLLDHMAQIREYLTTVSSTIPMFYQFTYEPIEMSLTTIKRFIKGPNFVLGCTGCCGSSTLTQYYLDSTTGKVMQIETYSGYDDEGENDKEETSVYAESFQEFLLNIIHESRLRSWKSDKPSEPKDPEVYDANFSYNYNILQLMCGFTRLAYEN
jgi:hypothetical protein